MSFVYPAVDELVDKPLLGDGECIQIVKMKVPGLIGISTRNWVKGESVMDSPNLRRGTAIATFGPDGRYPTANSGQHAALFLKHAGSGIWVMDMWRTRGKITKRFISIPRNREPRPDGTWPDASNNALAFSVIER
jgi:hypothetical protein